MRQLKLPCQAHAIPNWCRLAACAQRSQANEPKPVRTWTIKEVYARDLFERRKLFEAFPAARPGTRSLKPGDILGFHWFRPCKILGVIAEIHFFNDVFVMLRTLPCKDLLPRKASGSDEESQRRCAVLYQSLGPKYSGPMVAVRLDSVQVSLSNAAALELAR